jgi:hypothetical protein
MCWLRPEPVFCVDPIALGQHHGLLASGSPEEIKLSSQHRANGLKSVETGNWVHFRCAPQSVQYSPHPTGSVQAEASYKCDNAAGLHFDRAPELFQPRMQIS